jgi:hypothetical protein
MLSTTTVTDFNDDGAGSLRAAISASNSDAGVLPDTILLTAGTYQLTIANSSGYESVNAQGDLNVTNASHPLIIQGAGSTGPNATVIDQTTLDRVLEIDPGVTLILQDLEIEGGSAQTDSAGGTSEVDGGGILNLGNVTLTNVAVENNTATATELSEDAYGGGIYSSGTLTINGTIPGASLIESNTATGGTGSSGSSGGGFVYGGGIYAATGTTTDSITIAGTTISGNTATGGDGFDGSGSASDGGLGGDANGGGVSVDNFLGAPDAILSGDTISGNMTAGGAGGNAPSSMVAGDAGWGVGAGVDLLSFAVPSGNVDLSADTVFGNTAQGGAGGSAPSGGTNGEGGFAYGGGLVNDLDSSGSKVLNVTVANNSAIGGDGDTGGSAFGGGLDDASNGWFVGSSTVVGNTATGGASTSTFLSTGGGGGINNELGTDTALSLQNTIVAGNTAAMGADLEAYGTSLAATTEFNFIGDGTDSTLTNGVDGNKVGTTLAPLDPMLGPLKNNGGNVLTMAPTPGSGDNVLAAGDPSAALASGLSTDARGNGFARIIAGKIDIGAVETQFSMASVTSASTTENTQTTAGLVITPAAADAASVTNFQITGISGGTLYQNDGTTPIANGDFITVAQGAAGLKFTPTTGSLAAGAFTAQESASGNVGGLSGTTATAAITVTLAGATVTGATTTENTQTTSGLVITPGANDAAAAYFQITGITGGTLYEHDGTTVIASGNFITLVQGAAGLKFTPTTGVVGTASFNVAESTTSGAGGLSGPKATASINVTLAGSTITGATTEVNTQTTSGLVITQGATDSTAAWFQITGISGGTLYQNNGTTPIPNGEFITVAQGNAGLKFTPTTGSVATGSFNAQEATTNSVSGLSGPLAKGVILVSLTGATVTGATTTENTQTTSGLVITPAAADAALVTNFQITGVTGGTLYQHDGTTPIANGDFISVAQGAAGLKFTPTTGSLAAGSFHVQESTTNSVGGLSGPLAKATIAVTLQATVTDATTTENTQTTSGLVITPAAGDASGAYFQITYITGGKLYEHDGTTQIATGSFITLAQGEAGLKFTPNAGSLVAGGFSVRESTSAAVGGLSGPTARAAITVTLAGPSVTGATTTENVQTTSGLVIKPAAKDTSAAWFQITGITGGTLYQHDGTTVIANGSFITLAQGVAGLKFTPTADSLTPGSFHVQESTTNSVGGLSGPTATVAIAVTLSQPTVTNATTTESTQTTSGLVITPLASDTSAAYFQITSITGGTLYQHDGTTPIANGAFITLAQAAAGLKFTPGPGSLTAGGFTARQATTNSVGGLNGPTARAAITVTLAGPSVTGATTTENVQTTSGLVIKPAKGDTSAAYFQITGITGGTLFQHDGTTAIANGSFITLAQGAAGLKFTPTAGSLAAGSFHAQESTTSAVGGLSGAIATLPIAVTLSQPNVTNATTTENTQTTSGLVITPGPNDVSAAYFQITSITGGTLYQNDGTTVIANGAFITLAQGAAGLKFTPTTGSMTAGGFTVRQSTTNAVSGLNGPTARAAITVT